MFVNKGSSSDGFRKVRSPRKAPQNIKKSTRQSMIVKPGESRHRRFTFDGFQKMSYTLSLRY